MFFVVIVSGLVAGEWFTNRISACAILPMIYPRLNPALQGEIRQLYQALSADDTPMVRKAAFAATGSLSTVMKKENVKEVILPALKLLADDAADATRVHFVDCVLAIAPLFVGAGAAGADGEFAECFVPSLEAVSEDQSWRVRSKFAKSVDKLAEVIGQTLGAQYVLPAYARLLRDSEPEVRSAACSTLLGVCRASDATAYKTHIVSLLAGLAADSSAPVRVAMSEALADLCPALGKDTSMQMILPVVLRMLKDDDAEVRLNVIAKIDVLSKVLGPDQLSATLAPAVIEMAQDAKWRVRLSVMEKLAHIGKQLVHFFHFYFDLQRCIVFIWSLCCRVLHSSRAR
jgi:serine/threonine-protein phosphatase 2A regulatory subunit A